jgi:acetyl esterase/lipase
VIKPPYLALFVVSGVLALGAQMASWQPSPGHTQLEIWPSTVPDAQPVPGPEMMKIDSSFLVAGRHVIGVYNVTRPTMTVYAPKAKNTGVAVIVFPGGGFEGLAIDLEGTEVCDWLTSGGITCVLLKYRVPSLPYDWHCIADPTDLPNRPLR